MATNVAQTFIHNESVEDPQATASDSGPAPASNRIPDAILYGPIDASDPHSLHEELRRRRWTEQRERNYQAICRIAAAKGKPQPPRIKPETAGDKTKLKGLSITLERARQRNQARRKAAEISNDEDTGTSEATDAGETPCAAASGDTFHVRRGHSKAVQQDDRDAEESDQAPSNPPMQARPVLRVVKAAEVEDQDCAAEQADEELDLSGRSLPATFPTAAFGRHADAVRAIAAHQQVSESMVGSILLVIVAALAQAFVGVSAYRGARGNPVSIFLMLIAESGERKSSTIEALLRPVLAILRKATDQRRQLILGDPTVDGTIIGLIRRCPAQLLLAPEGATLLGSHAMNSNNLPRFAGTLTAVYSGEPISRVRAKEYEYAEDRRLSAVIAVQEIIATSFLSNDLVMQQGLANRFIYDKPASKMGSRTLSRTDLQQNEDYQSLAEHLGRLAAHPWTIDDDTEGVSTRTICLSDDAFELWEVFYNYIESQLGKGGQLVNHAGYASRFSEQILRFAANLAVLDDPDVTEISGEVMERAMELAEYYLPTALHLFSAAPASAEEQRANALLQWMRNKMAEYDLPAIPTRLIYRYGPHPTRTCKAAHEALSLLVARGDIVPYDKPVMPPDGKRSRDNYLPV